jgi:hypothetical protein
VYVVDRLATCLRNDEHFEGTVSLGVAKLNRGEPATTRLVRDADAALYDAKAMGSDRVLARGRPRVAPSSATASPSTGTRCAASTASSPTRPLP